MAVEKQVADKLDALSVDQKFTRVLLDIKDVRPFFKSVFQCMTKEETEEIPTMAVSIDKLYYNYNYVDSLTYAEFVFVVLHEIAHVALQHVARIENRDPTFWNIAADYYVNALLVNEFNLNPNKDNNTLKSGMNISLPEGILYTNTIDLDLDSVENLYESLMVQDRKYDKEMAGEDPGPQGDAGGEEGDDGSNSQGEGEGNGEGNEDSDLQGDGEGDNSKPNPNKKPSQKREYIVRGSLYKSGKNAGGKITIDKNAFNKDLIPSKMSQEEANAKSRQILSNAQVRHQLDGLKNIGTGSGLLHSQAIKSLQNAVKWQNVLKRFLISATASDSSYSNPDKRFAYQRGAIFPGLVAEELDKIEGVKICIDVSASIAKETLSEFLGQVWAICKTFKISAEVLYWDATITSKGKFTGYNEFERVNQIGGGGTDPACLFDYFNSKECKDKPIVNLIFTDGYVYDQYDTPLNHRRYRNNTLWIISKGGDPEYKPAFGKVIYPKWK